MADWVKELNRLAGTSGLEAAGAANALAGTSGLEVVGALNAAAGTAGIEFAGVCRRLAILYGGNPSFDPNLALASIASMSLGDTLLQESGDDIALETGEGALLLDA